MAEGGLQADLDLQTSQLSPCRGPPGPAFASFVFSFSKLLDGKGTELPLLGAAFQSNLGNGKFRSNLHLFPKLDGFQ